jgi:hypothetical protein
MSAHTSTLASDMFWTRIQRLLLCSHLLLLLSALAFWTLSNLLLLLCCLGSSLCLRIFQKTPGVFLSLSLRCQAMTRCSTLVQGLLPIGESGFASEYHAHKLSPVNVKKVLEFGYTITHIRLLAYCSIPSPSHCPKIRTVVVALEAVFTALFWAFEPPEDGNTSRFGLDHMCQWDQDAFEWLGLCSYSSLQESIRCPEGELDFTSEELEDIARLIKEKNAKYQRDYGKAQRTNPTEEFKQQQKAKNERHKPKLEQQQQAAIKNKTHYCEPCDVSCRDAASLRRHNGTKGHLLKLEHPDGFICPDCNNIEFQYYSDLQEHFKCKSHRLNAAS